MSEIIYQLKLNQDVQTPNGPGVIQGRMVVNDQTQILVAHDPKKVNLPDGLMRLYRGGIWVLNSYPIEQVTPLKS